MSVSHREILFEVFFCIMVLMAIAAAISGAATALNDYVGIAVVVPFLTVGAYKNRKYMKEHGEEFEAR